MAVDVKVIGLENVEALMDQAERELAELRKALNEINAAIRTIGLEVNQSSEGPTAD